MSETGITDDDDDDDGIDLSSSLDIRNLYLNIPSHGRGTFPEWRSPKENFLL